MRIAAVRRRPAPRLLVSALAAVWLVAGCGVAPTTSPGPSGSPSSALAGASAYAEDFKPPYRLAFELPRTTWRAGDAITGTATLSLVGLDSAEIGGSGSGLIGFSFVEAGSGRDVEPAQTSDCRGYGLDLAHPIRSAIAKSGAFTPEQPDAAFYRSFLTDALVHLPPGDWTITAISTFSERSDCSRPPMTLRAGIAVHVVP